MRFYLNIIPVQFGFMNEFNQLILGNPGTSFVVCLMQVLNKKYGFKFENEDQIKIFMKGIVNSPKVFWSGVINHLALKYRKEIQVYVKSWFKKFAETEVDSEYVFISQNPLTLGSVDILLDTYTYIIFTVDINFFLPYHDYHFVTISKNESNYSVFEPKSGKTILMPNVKFAKLITSVTTNLKDISIAFCL